MIELEVANSSSRTWTYTYDDDNRLTRVVTPVTTQNFEFDNLGRRTKRHGVTGTTDAETFTYDPAGNMLTAAGSGFTATLTYDNANRLKTVDEDGKTTTFNYTQGRLSSRIDAAGTTSFTYNANGLLATLVDPLGPATTTYGYDTAGRQVSRAGSGGLSWTRTYELASGRVDTQTVANTGGTVASFDLGYDKVSNVTSKAQNVTGYTGSDNGTWTYTYDDANRMVSATDPGSVTTSYAYDGAGNRTAVGSVTTTFNTAGQPVSSSDGTTYTNALDGNLTGISGGPRTWTYTYDTWNRQETAVGAGGTPSLSFDYDALDRTMRRTSGSVTTSYAYIGLSEDPAWTSDGTTTTTYAHSPGGPLAQKIGSAVRYYVSDLHEDVVGMADTTGALAGTKSFGPWGDGRATTAEQGAFGFQGDLTDSDTGSVDMLTRNYDPLLGRFLSQDVLFGTPASPMSLNQFGYGIAAPVRFTDPTGMMPLIGEGCSCAAPPPDPPAQDVMTPTGAANAGSFPTLAYIPPKPTVPLPLALVGGLLLQATGALTTISALQNRAIRAAVPWVAGRISGWAEDFGRGQGFCILGHAATGRCRGATTIGNGIRRSWHVARFALNAPVTLPSWAYAETAGGGDCSLGSGLIIECNNVRSWSNGPRPVLTLGGVILNENTTLSTTLRSHETRHADQWAILGPIAGPVTFATTYFASEIVSQVGHALPGVDGEGSCWNIFERWAGAGEGGYDC